MPSSWEIIANHLRTELQGYGGLLALFEEQQNHLLQRNPDAVLSLAQTIETQARVTAEHRLQRELFVREVAELHGYPSDSHLRQLLPRFPAEVQPLLDALMDEVNHLIHRVRRGARQNQQLLARAVEMHQEMLRTIRPAAFVKTYSPRGQISVSTNDAAWQAAG
jgi:flagellar biosynthesis/type III secretory pathway chaperone